MTTLWSFTSNGGREISVADVINAERFASAISDLMEDYADEVKSILDETVPKAAKTAVKKLRKGGSYNDTGKSGYTKGWTSQSEVSRLNVSAVVYNRKAPGLAHLLEFGHLTRDGKRTREFPHIAPVAQATEDELEKLLREALE